MREPDERATIITTDGGRGGAGIIAGALLVIAAVALIVYLFVDFGGVNNTPSATIEAPNVTIEAPKIDVHPPAPNNEENTPQAPTAPGPTTD